MAKKTEEEIREEVTRLKHFYMMLCKYGALCLLAVLIWASTGEGHFWPIWVVLGGGIFVALEAVHIGKLPVLEEIFPFLKSDWEDEQIKQRLNKDK